MKKILALSLLALIIWGCSGGDGEGDGNRNNTPNADGNRAPSVYAGDDRAVVVGSTVALDGSNCSDSDGDLLTFDWRFVSRPQGSAATISDNAATNPEFTADSVGEYIIELTVSDGSHDISDSVIITAATGQTVSDCSQIVPGASPADDFVCSHNAVRENAQPAPVPPLPPMTWDVDLEQIARDYAEQCTWGHNPHRSDTYPGSVGENIYASYGMAATPETVVQAWASEDQDYDYDSNTCQSGRMCGHYTQIVWRESIKVGCAQVNCPTLYGLGWTNADYVVCNYAPAGNYYGEKPY